MTTLQNHFKRNSKLLFFTLLIGLSYISCNKNKNEPTYVITGTISDINSNANLEGVEISLKQKKVSSGTFNNSYSLIETQSSTSNGQFSFSTPFGNVESFLLTLKKDNYFSVEKTINPDNLTIENDNVMDFTMQSKGTIQINLINSNPFDSLDKITFYSQNSSCTNCVKFDNIIVKGISADTLLQGQVEANKYYKFQYFTFKNNTTTSYLDSVFCTVGNTTLKIVNY